MDSLQKKFEKFTIAGNWKIVGSASTRGMIYWSDIDVEDYLHGRASTLAKHFQDVAKMHDDLVFLELKAGIDSRYEGDARKIRWNRKQVIQGYKLKSGKKFLLDQCISDNSILKLDLAVPFADRWFDVSIRYFYKQKKENQEDIMQELENDVDEYKGIDTLKSLKRFYSILKLEGKKDDELKEFFNSKVGFLNKQRSDLDLLDKLSDHDIQPHLDQISINLQNMIPKKMIGYIQTNRPKIIMYLRKLGEKLSIDFLKKNAEKFIK